MTFLSSDVGITRYSYDKQINFDSFLELLRKDNSTQIIVLNVKPKTIKLQQENRVVLLTFC